MRYLGSKNRHAKEILPIILAGRGSQQTYVEPFMGGCNILDKVDGPRIGNDAHPFLKPLFEALVNGWKPPKVVTEALYRKVRMDKSTAPPYLVGFIGFGCSFGGKWFAGYARGGFKSDGSPRNYALESRTNVLAQARALQGCLFACGSYDALKIPPKSIIYCDPPYYATTKGYANTGDFNHVEFWRWCRKMRVAGHTVFISEYVAPPDFKVVWSRKVFNTLAKDTGSKIGTEKLFTPIF